MLTNLIVRLCSFPWRLKWVMINSLVYVHWVDWVCKRFLVSLIYNIPLCFLYMSSRATFLKFLPRWSENSFCLFTWECPGLNLEEGAEPQTAQKSNFPPRALRTIKTFPRGSQCGTQSRGPLISLLSGIMRGFFSLNQTWHMVLPLKLLQRKWDLLSV